MCDDIGVTDEIKAFVLDLLSKNNFGAKCEVKYSSGTAPDDGYGSKTIAVDVTEDERSLHLFLKCALTLTTDDSFKEIYKTEILLYKTIYPTYQRFLKDKNVENGFGNVPVCYGVNEKVGSEIVALDNLRKKNYTLYDKSKCMNDAHLKLVLETFAKFHAISFAFKDQHRQLHDEFLANRTNIYALLEGMGLVKTISNIVEDFVSKLDPVEDKDILDRSGDLASNVFNQFMNMKDYLSDYSILTKGDCWVNNMMFLYENEDTERPLDMMLIDWQGVTRASPLHDIGVLILSISSKETLENIKFYLGLYHNELSSSIRELGSDPNILYPYEVLEREWTKYGLYFFGVAIIALRVMLCEKGNGPVMEEERITASATVAEQLFGNINTNEELVMERLKYIARHLIKIGTI